jgi:two-component system phosphate regulon sensor histidine kinase PhoR
MYSKYLKWVFIITAVLSVLMVPIFAYSVKAYQEIAATSPEPVDLMPYIYVPALIVGGIGFILHYFLAHFIAEDSAKPLNDLIRAMSATFDGDLSEDMPAESEAALIRYLGDEDKARQFLAKLNELRESENVRRQFSANVTHELKSPLTSINGYAELIESGMTSDEDTIRFAGIIHKEGVRLLNMINEIIQLSRFDSGYSDYDLREDFDLVQVTQEEMAVMEPQADDRDVEFSLTADGPVVVHGNKGLLTDMVRNLLSNAVKYSKGVAGHVDVTLSKEDGIAILSVRDNGIGISQEDLPHIFERFFIANRARAGNSGSHTGLGLALVKHTVQAHGGQVQVKSQLGEGSEFIVRLPEDGLPDEVRFSKREPAAASKED